MSGYRKNLRNDMFEKLDKNGIFEHYDDVEDYYGQREICPDLARIVEKFNNRSSTYKLNYQTRIILGPYFGFGHECSVSWKTQGPNFNATKIFG